MKVAVGCDHAGFPVKEAVEEQVKALGHEVLVMGTYNTQSVTIPILPQKWLCPSVRAKPSAAYLFAEAA